MEDVVFDASVNTRVSLIMCGCCDVVRSDELQQVGDTIVFHATCSACVICNGDS